MAFKAFGPAFLALILGVPPVQGASAPSPGEDRGGDPPPRQQQEPPPAREKLSQFDPQWFDMGEGGPSAIEQARSVYRQIHVGDGSVDAHLKNAQDAICANQGCKADSRQSPMLLEFALPGRNALARAYNHLKRVIEDVGLGVSALKASAEALDAAAERNKQNSESLDQAAQGLARFPAGMKIRPPESEGDNGATQEALARIRQPDAELRRLQQQLQSTVQAMEKAGSGFTALQQEAQIIEDSARKAGEAHSNSLASLGDRGEGGPSYQILRSALDRLKDVRQKIAKILAAGEATLQELNQAGHQADRVSGQVDQAAAMMSELLEREQKIHSLFPEVRQEWDRGTRAGPVGQELAAEMEKQAQLGRGGAEQQANQAARTAATVARSAANGGCKECIASANNIAAAFGDPKGTAGLPALGALSLSIVPGGNAQGTSSHNVTFGKIRGPAGNNNP